MTLLCHACFILSSLIKASEAVRTVQDNGRGLKKLEPNELLEIIDHCYPDHAQQTQRRRRRRETIGTGNISESGDAETGAAVLEERVYDGQLAARGEFPATVSVSVSISANPRIPLFSRPLAFSLTPKPSSMSAEAH